MMEIDYEDVLHRIQTVYASCSKMEQNTLKTILQEMVDKGYSQTLEQLWLSDFKEVPVSIEEFLCNPRYLGNTNNNGESVYPFWKHTLTDIFNNGNKYFEIILSGATRIGKSSTGVSGMAYMLYRLMLYKNPHAYFKKKEVSKFTIAFANLTKDLAAGVAFREFQTTLKESPWFNEHGKFSNSASNYVYMPEGGKIDIIPASDSAHVLGMQVWACLVGETKIITSEGAKHIAECVDSNVNVLQLVDGKFVFTPADVKLTKYVQDTIRVELEDGTIIEGTPDHKILLSDGSYVQLDSLTYSDDIMTFGSSAVSSADRLSTKIKSIQDIHHNVLTPVYDVINVKPAHNFVICSDDTFVISHNCLMDEVNFTRSGVKDINIAKQHMKNLYNTVHARITGTFKLGGEVYGKLISSSSKNTDSDYLSEHIETQLNAGNSHMYLVDKPQWEVLPKEMFSSEKFYITVGDRYKRGFVVPKENEDEQHIEEYKNSGYRVLAVPKDFRTNFLADYDIALRDIAGISVTGAMGFITQDAITPNVTSSRKNPFFEDIIVTGIRDNDTLENHFHADVVDKHIKSLPMNVHIDFAEVSDRIGISGVVQDGMKNVLDLDTERRVMLPFYRQVFQVGIEAPSGDRMSFQKVINFIVWLRRSGFNINIISTDQYQSSYVRETLSQQGFAVEKVSVDASEDPYIGLRNLLQDQRLELIKNQKQEDELVKLQRLNKRIDHPQNGSKDLSDALCGACWTHIQHQDQIRPSVNNMANVISSVNGRPTSPKNRLPSVFGSYTLR